MMPVLAITGPTAVGKSAVADALALRLGTEVISADAMQVYRGMDIGTAKTPVDDRPVPLRLVDIVDPREPYSAALYQRDARLEIERLNGEGRVAVLCGGSGLYLRAARGIGPLLRSWAPTGCIDCLPSAIPRAPRSFIPITSRES